MSTYYYFNCNKCKKRSEVVLSEHLNGWNCASEQLKFIIKHIPCATENLEINSEHKFDPNLGEGYLDYEVDTCED